MARTPSLSAEEAEATLGERGLLTVTSENRGTVQKWLTAKGVPATVAKSARLATLAKAYNDESDRYLSAIIRNAGTEPAEPVTQAEPESPSDLLAAAVEQQRQEAEPVTIRQTNHTVTTTKEKEPAPMPQINGQDSKADAAKHLHQALALIAAGGAMNEERVLELIREHAPKPEPTTTTVLHVVEVKRDGEPTVTVEGAHPLLADVVDALSLGLNVALVGPAGCGKTHLAEQAAEALSLQFYMSGAVDSRYELSGFVDAGGNYQRTPFREAFENGGVFLLDEMDGSDPGAFLWLNAALANGVQAFPDGMVKRHPDFRCIAAANTFGHGADRLYVGRNQLDAASLDRFKPQIDMDYDADLEARLCGNEAWAKRVQAMRESARQAKDRVVLSMRASIAGAKLLAKGWAVERVEDTCLFAGIDPSVKQRLRAAGDRAASVR